MKLETRCSWGFTHQEGMHSFPKSISTTALPNASQETGSWLSWLGCRMRLLSWNDFCDSAEVFGSLCIFYKARLLRHRLGPVPQGLGRRQPLDTFGLCCKCAQYMTALLSKTVRPTCILPYPASFWTAAPNNGDGHPCHMNCVTILNCGSHNCHRCWMEGQKNLEQQESQLPGHQLSDV